MAESFGKIEISKLKKGNEATFERIFNSFYPELVSFARGFVKDEDQSREFVQEAFFTLWEKRETLYEDSNIRAYLYTVTRNLCINYLQSQQIRGQSLELTDKEIEEKALTRLIFASTPGSELDLAELGDRIETLIESLPEQNRRVFKMNRFERMTYAQIASELGITQKTVEAHVSRALKFLREKLSGFF